MSDRQLQRYQRFIGGKSVAPVEGRWFESSNRYTGEAWAESPHGSEADVDAAAGAGPTAELLANDNVKRLFLGDVPDELLAMEDAV